MTETVHYDFDPQLRLEFIDAALEGLDGLGGLFAQLEAESTRGEAVDAIFRIVHSLKGNAAFFEFIKVQALAHETETLLDRIRKGHLAPSRPVTDALLAATDELTAMFARSRQDRPEVEDDARFDAMLARLRAVWLGEPVGIDDLLRTLLESLIAIGTSKTLEQARGLAARAHDVTRRLAAEGIGSVGLAAPESAPPWPEPAARLRDLLALADPSETFDHLRAEQTGSLWQAAGNFVAGAEARTVHNEAAECYRLFMTSVGVDPVLRQVLNDAMDKIAALGGWRSARPAAAAPHEEHGRGGSDGLAIGAAKTMRVSEESVDAFLADVGHLDGIDRHYERIETQVAGLPGGAQLAEELGRANASLRSAAERLRTAVLEMRRMPLLAVLQRVPRIVRDVAGPAGKEVEVRTAGGEIMADKSIVDALETPLMHLVRNAADHGIETPDQREAAGKPPTGVIEVRASETAGEILLSVRDDGRGIDFGALHRQAAALGLAPDKSGLSEEEAMDLLFRPGVSTAAQVTEVSGRGVGLDSVRRGVEPMGGGVSVTTELGLGSTFVIRLPKASGAPAALAAGNAVGPKT